ncbi:uncharacterized protein [Glycine max]|nr:uncharacterized protein LOC121174140 [Glycine max]
MTQLETSQTPQGPSQAFTTTPTTSMGSVHRLKLEVPRFDGMDPTGWIFKISQFFEYHATPEHERLTIASFYMEGKALAWFQWMYRNGQLTSWPAFLHALHTRFSSSTYKDPTGMLCKLTQQSSTAEYLAEFESLANCVIGLPTLFVLSCFVSGLSPTIRREVQVMQPQSLTQAVSFARLHEEKLMDGRRQNTRIAKLPSPQPSSPAMSLEPSLPQGTIKPSSSAIPFKRLSPSELALRHEKGLCFNCDEKFSRGHKCTPSLFLFVTNDNEGSQEPVSAVSGAEEPPAQISLLALSDHGAPETLRVIGVIGNHKVRILIDGGSTHNFLQLALLTTLGLSPQNTSPLKVTVGNGEELQCHQLCPDVPVNIQDHEFTVDFHVLPFCGANVVLGVQWLKSLGPVLTDYTSLTMKFIYAGKLIELTGERDKNMEQISASQLCHPVHTGNTSSYFHIRLEPNITTTLPSPCQIPEINQLLTKYAPLFKPSNTLPPSRPTDHTINLLPNSTPVSTRPYHYPYSQKQEIENQVATMLSQGHIQHSSSPFSSPVLLVKKRDGT